MSKGGAGCLGFASGGIAAVILLLAGTEAVFQYQCAQEPPRDDFQCLGPGLERDFTRLIGSPLAVLFGGGFGCWVAVERRTSRCTRTPRHDGFPW